MAISTIAEREAYFASTAERKSRAIERDVFYNQNHYGITRCLKSDLIKTYSIEDIPNLKYITFDFFVSQILQRLVNVYNIAPVFKFEDGVNRQDKDRFSALMQEVEYQRTWQEASYKCRLHNTIIECVKFNQALNKVYLSNDYNVGDTEIVTWAGYNYDAMIIAYDAMMGDDQIWYVWDKVSQQHYFIKSDFEYDPVKGVIGKKYPIPGNERAADPLAKPKDLWPFTIRRYKQQDEDFWGHGLDSLIELNRVINILATISMDDIINETLAIWLFNFNPAEAGSNKASDGRIKTGKRNPLFFSSKVNTGKEPTGQVIRAELQTEQIIGFVDMLSDKLSSMFGIENVLKQQLSQDLSGIALRLRNEPLLRQWNEDINIWRACDLQSCQNIVALNNYYRQKSNGLKNYKGEWIEDNYIDPAILDKMTIDYQEPEVVTDEAEEFDTYAKEARIGLKSWVSRFLKRNPEMSEKEAEKKIKENKKINSELAGISGLSINVDNTENLANENRPTD